MSSSGDGATTGDNARVAVVVDGANGNVEIWKESEKDKIFLILGTIYQFDISTYSFVILTLKLA